MSSDSLLAQNLKFLRTKNGFSQEQLANRLDIKRASIAAYESKGVEPRLRILNKMSKLFNVSLEWFLSKNLTQEETIPHYGMQMVDQISISSGDIDKDAFNAFVEKSTNIRKVLEGFKAYNNLIENKAQLASHNTKLTQDLDNFTKLLEQLLNQNETFINSFNRVQQIQD
jgi:transcriptional regulator with XRE-family HTH domain